MADNLFADGCAFIEGAYYPISEARISIVDTGFTRSDLTYDVVAVWNGKFFRLDEHLNRFQKSWQRLRLSPGLSLDEMRAILFECVRRSGLRNAYVEMILSRGVDEEGSRDPRRFSNRFYAYAIPYVWIAKPEDQTAGIHLVIAEKTIRIPSESVDPTVKNFHWGDLIRGIYEAYDRGGFTAVLPDAEGYITEGPGFNIFVYSDDTLLTPASGVLEGITRQTVLELAEEQGIPSLQTMFKAEVLENAAEVFITSTAGGVIPVTTVNGRSIGDGKPGPVTIRIQQRYWEIHDEAPWATAVDYSVD
ncbi:Branched-chain amino acid aminotransferase (EC [Olavius algarvensis Delta 1 endosymbiont]|nr:Branched-chain amino acid aminotransferase (EC [Olavius algarvensis Delta 1 endosymbiont]